MSTAAVIVLNTLARDEFEREWHGFEDPLSFLNGDYIDQPPIETLECVVDGKTYVFNAADVAGVITATRQGIEWEVEAEAEELAGEEDYEPNPSFLFRGEWHQYEDAEAAIEAKIEEKLTEHWMSQIETAEETLATLDCRLYYMGEATKELVAYMEMIMGRVPELRPAILEKLNEVREYLNTMFAEWIEKLSEEDGQVGS
jgi:hypothetical protein